MVNKKTFKVIETFSGIGAQAKALKNINANFEIVHTADWDINAILAYFAIHKVNVDFSKYKSITNQEIDIFLHSVTLSSDGKKPISDSIYNKLSEQTKKYLYIAIKECKNLVSIMDIRGSQIPDVDLFTYSFPCQDLSLCGAWTGGITGISRFVHNRSGLLWEVERILLEMKKNNQKLPTFLLMENVPNILSPRHLPDFNDWQKSLKSMGYYNQVYVLDARDFGRIQKRRRAYMISVLCNNDKQKDKVKQYFYDNSLEFHIPENKKKKILSDILKIDYSNEIYLQEALLSTPNDTPSRQVIYDENVHLLHNGEPRDVLVDCVTTKQDRNPNSGTVDLPEELYREGKAKWRFLTPRECFMLMGFDEEDFTKVKNLNTILSTRKAFMSQEKMVKLAGNSIVVDVLEEIFKQILFINEKILKGESK